jgi:hypothetical protein
MKENNGKLKKMEGYDREQRKMTAKGGKMTENDGENEEEYYCYLREAS